MRVGVVSDTHNNHKNVNKIIKIFNQEDVGVVFHTGDISNSKTLSLFQKLHANLIGVYGNNDREERGLDEVRAMTSENLASRRQKFYLRFKTILTHQTPGVNR